VGLAAPQVAVGERLIVVEWADEPENEDDPPRKKRLFVVINPEIVRASEEMVQGTEGCLSVPGWVGDVMRHEAVTVRGLNRNGEKIKIEADGWLARIFQHEIDHLDGVLYIDRLVSKDTLRRVEAGTEEAVKLIAGLLEREARAQRLTLDAPTFAAQLFLHMVISWPQRRAVVLGKPMTPAELDAWTRDVVNLFLNGCRGWMPATL
jgi:peptide deformylase